MSYNRHTRLTTTIGDHSSHLTRHGTFLEWYHFRNQPQSWLGRRATHYFPE